MDFGEVVVGVRSKKTVWPFGAASGVLNAPGFHVSPASDHDRKDITHPCGDCERTRQLLVTSCEFLANHTNRRNLIVEGVQG